MVVNQRLKALTILLRSRVGQRLGMVLINNAGDLTGLTVYLCSQVVRKIMIRKQSTDCQDDSQCHCVPERKADPDRPDR